MKQKLKVTFTFENILEYEAFMEQVLSNDKGHPYESFMFNKAGRKQFDESFPPVTDEKELQKLSKLYSNKRKARKNVKKRKARR